MTPSSPNARPARIAARPAAALRMIAAFGALALLSACASHTRLSAADEAHSYRENARSSYGAPGPSNDPWGPYIHEASDRYDIPERWIREVMRVESGGRTEMGGRPITSGAGAMGLMQVMPATYDELRGRYSLGSDPYDPHNSILAGTAYIRELYDLYGSPGFLAAYNGGPGRLDDYLTRNRGLPDETRRYVAKIGPYITDTFPRRRSTAEAYAMNSVPTSIPAGPRYPDAATQPAYAAPAPPPSPAAAPIAAPVEVAYAPPAAADGAFDPPPGWTPRAMGRQVAASYVPPSGDAALPAPARVYEPAPVPAQEAVPLPAAPPSGFARLERRAFTTPPERRPVPVQVAQAAPLPVPPPLPAPYVPSVQPVAAYAQANTLQHREPGFRLVQTANAAAAPLYRGSAGQWAIQVGAFGNEGLARIAVDTAREHAAASLTGARPDVETVHEPHGTLYRARLVGLSRDAASQACERLRGHSNCIVLSPEAQN